jgi:hypothetical protein
MTIAALDKDMVQLENSLMVIVNRCDFSGGPRPPLIS